jgi:hypothetical protein
MAASRARSATIATSANGLSGGAPTSHFVGAELGGVLGMMSDELEKTEAMATTDEPFVAQWCDKPIRKA